MPNRTRISLVVGVLAVAAWSLPSLASAAAVAFQNPGTASWGNWTRGSAGSIYVHYDVFTADSLRFDITPDKGKFGATNVVLQTNQRPTTPLPAGQPPLASSAFITGSANIYSFADVLDFDLIIQPTSAHTSLAPNTPITVALQLSILGSNIDDSSIKLGNKSYNSKVVLSSGSASGPGGTGTGVDNEYLYLWYLTGPSAIYTFDFAALSTSLSLDAVSVDIGRTAAVVPPVTPPVIPPVIPPVVPPVTPPVTPPTTPVPLPMPALLLGAAMLGLLGRSPRRRA